MKRQNKPKQFTSYVPSETLVARTQQMLERYPIYQIAERFEVLSRNMLRECEWLNEHSTGPMTRSAVEAKNLNAAAKDLLEIRDTINDVAQGLTLEYRITEKSPAAHLRLFDSYMPRLPTRIQKALSETAEWCSEQMDVLDNRADDMIQQTQNTTLGQAEVLGKNLQYLDETMGLLHVIREWAAFATSEVMEAKQQFASHGRGIA